MSIESMTARKRKRIVECVISGFDSGYDAIKFGNTVDELVEEVAGKQKFRQQIGSKETKLAITETWVGDTVLKMTFLELADNDLANAVGRQIEKTISLYKGIHPKCNLMVDEQIIMEKPQPQFIGSF